MIQALIIKNTQKRIGKIRTIFLFEFLSALQIERISLDRPSFAFDFSFLIGFSRIEFVVVVCIAVDSVSWFLFRHGAFEFGTCKRKLLRTVF
jgi:hypothetical protein